MAVLWGFGPTLPYNKVRSCFPNHTLPGVKLSTAADYSVFILLLLYLWRAWVNDVIFHRVVLWCLPYSIPLCLSSWVFCCQLLLWLPLKFLFQDFAYSFFNPFSFQIRGRPKTNTPKRLTAPYGPQYLLFKYRGPTPLLCTLIAGHTHPADHFQRIVSAPD